jgi:hypothetical protein
MVEHERAQFAMTHCQSSRDLPRRRRPSSARGEQLVQKELDHCPHNGLSRPPLERRVATDLDERIVSS